ncbi:MAG: hypothetical protein HKL96_12625 [Phycisphaerales bacterium]|nr:hypothetical protein [Phycisphaerales bacterium]
MNWHTRYCTLVVVAVSLLLAGAGQGVRASQGGFANKLDDWPHLLRQSLNRFEQQSGLHNGALPPGTQQSASVRLQMKGLINWNRWLVSLPPSERASLQQYTLVPTAQKAIEEAFAPSRRMRAASLKRIAGLAPSDDVLRYALLDTLLLDSSRYVRLSVMNVLWKMPPDAKGAEELFWLAAKVNDDADFVFYGGGRVWKPLYKLLPPPQTSPGVILAPRPGGEIHRFYAADRDRIMALLTHWSAPTLQQVLLAHLAGFESPGPEHVGYRKRAVRLNKLVYAELFAACRPRAAVGYLMNAAFYPAVHRGANLSPQGRPTFSRSYYKNSRTDALFLLMLALGANPTHHGIVVIGQNIPNVWHEVSPVIVAQSHKAQSQAISYMRGLCQSRHFRRFAGGLPAPAVAARHGDENRQAPRGSLAQFRLAIKPWYLWAMQLPAGERSAMLVWGSQASIIENVALAFAASPASMRDACRELAADSGPQSQRILCHLLHSRHPSVQKEAMNALQGMKLDGQSVRALWLLATTLRLPISDVQYDGVWHLMYHDRAIVVPRLVKAVRRHACFWATKSSAFKLLQRKAYAGPLCACALDDARNERHGSGALYRIAFVSRQWRTFDHTVAIYVHTPGHAIVSELLADIHTALPGPNWSSYEDASMDARLAPLIILCRKAHVSLSAYGIECKSASGTPVCKYWAAGNAELTAGIERMTRLWAARGVKPAP